MKSVRPLKDKPGRQSLEKGLLCIFQATGNIPLQRYRASITKHRQQSTKVRAKGVDPIWSQVCSSLLQQEILNQAVCVTHYENLAKFYSCFNLACHLASTRLPRKCMSLPLEK